MYTVLSDLAHYNNLSDCDPEWHSGFCEALDKVEEIAARHGLSTKE